MKRPMNYKGYSGDFEFDEEAKIFHGEVEGIHDVVIFQGSTINELEQAFHDSIEEYLEFCSARGEVPEKPVRGKLLLRLPTSMYRGVMGPPKSEGGNFNFRIVSKSGSQGAGN